MKKDEIYNPIERLIRYRTVMSSAAEITVDSLSKALGIPSKIVMNDIKTVVGSANPFILPEDDLTEDINNDTILELIDFDEDDYYEKLSVPVDIDEFLAFQNLFEQNVMPKKVTGEKTLITKSIRNKKYVYDIPAFVLELLDSVEAAISDKLNIEFDFMFDSVTPRHYVVSPARIGFDASESQYVLISFSNGNLQCFDMERISNIKISKTPYEINDDFFENADKVWGFEYDKCIDPSGERLKPLRVSVKFYDEANVLEKVKRDLTYRNPIELKHLPTGEVIYTDDVYGIESFKRWIYSYGSSAEILKPQKLRKEFAKELESLCSNI